MYEQHFGFSRPVFSPGMAQDEDVFKTATIDQLARDLEIALVRRDAVAVLSGMSGTGKTTIASDALKNIDTQLAFSSIGHPPLSAEELLEQLLTDFGFEPNRKSRVERLQIWRQFLSEMATTNTRVCLLIEHAEDWSNEVLQCLHNLSVADADISPGANVVLTTGEPAEHLLDSPELMAFNQRIRLRRALHPFTETETRDYLAFKCRNAGADPERVLSADTGKRLHEFSGGVVRVVDNLLESALMSAAKQSSDVVTAEIVGEVAVQQFGLQPLEAEVVEDLLRESDELTVEVAADDDGIPTLTDVVDLPDEVDSQESIAELSSIAGQS